MRQYEEVKIGKVNPNQRETEEDEEETPRKPAGSRQRQIRTEDLMMAAETGNTQCLEEILNTRKHGMNAADINFHSQDEWTPLHIVANEGHYHVANILLGNGADIEAKSSNFRTPLHIACIRGHTDIVKLLLNRGAQINSKDLDMNTPTHFCAEYGHPELLKLLLSHHPGLRMKNKKGQTPVDIACSNPEVL